MIINQIRGHRGQDRRVRFDPSEEAITGRAKQSTNHSRRVAVIDKQAVIQAPANSAPVVLLPSHLGKIILREAIFLLQASSCVLRLCQSRVRNSPPTKPSVPFRSVSHAIGAGSFIRAFPAIRAPILARFSKSRQGQFPLAIRALFHEISMACSAWQYQPVPRVRRGWPENRLLEIANEAVEA